MVVTTDQPVRQDVIDELVAGDGFVDGRAVSSTDPGWSSTRSTRAPSRTPTATASATCPAIAARLDHVARLGADALWLSPVYPSPMADGGYDVADYTDVDPRFGTLEDFDALIAARPCARPEGAASTSSRATPRSSTRGSASTPTGTSARDGRRPAEQLARDLRRPGLVARPSGRRLVPALLLPRAARPGLAQPRGRAAMRRRRCASGSRAGWTASASTRSTACSRTRSCATTRSPPGRRRCPLHADYATLEHAHSRDAPDIGTALAALRDGGRATRCSSARSTCRRRGPRPLPRAPRRRASASSCFTRPGRPGAARPRSRRPRARRASIAWVLSNHDFRGLPTRVGAAHVRAAALLLLTLPGLGFVYQGDEIGDGRRARARARPTTARGATATATRCSGTRRRTGGFTTGEPWLRGRRPAARNVAGQRGDPGSLLALVPRADRRCAATLRGPLPSTTPPTACSRSAAATHLLALNLGAEARPGRARAPLVVGTHATADDGTLPPRGSGPRPASTASSARRSRRGFRPRRMRACARQ